MTTGSFPHDNFSSVYWIFTKLDHILPNPIYFGVIRSKVNVTVTINIDIRSFPHDNFSSVYWIFNKLGHMIPLWKGKNPIYFGVKGQGHHYYKYNFWQQDRFHKTTLVLYFGPLPNLPTWFPCGRGRTLLFWGHYHYTVW